MRNTADAAAVLARRESTTDAIAALPLLLMVPTIGGERRLALTPVVGSIRANKSDAVH